MILHMDQGSIFGGLIIIRLVNFYKLYLGEDGLSNIVVFQGYFIVGLSDFVIYLTVLWRIL